MNTTRRTVLGVFIILGVWAPPKAAFINGGPYIGPVAHDSAVISWQTDNNSTGNQVEWGATASYGNTAASAAGVEYNGQYVHHSVLKGLTARTRFYYRVRSDALVSPGYSFRTFPLPGTSTGLKLAVTGDTRWSAGCVAGFGKRDSDRGPRSGAFYR
jgi:phosphodiesterase/alkaline phosphatase D-like protein